MDGISKSRGWDKEIPHGILPIEQLVLSNKWARKRGWQYTGDTYMTRSVASLHKEFNTCFIDKLMLYFPSENKSNTCFIDKLMLYLPSENKSIH